MGTYEAVEPGAGKVRFYAVFAFLVILAGNLVYPKEVSAIPFKASSASTGCNVNTVNNSAAAANDVHLRPGHIRYVLKFICGRWSDVAISSLARTDLAPDGTIQSMEQGAGTILVTGSDSERIVASPAIITVELIKPELGYRHDASGTRIVPSTTPFTVKVLNLEYGYQHDARGTRIVPSPAQITVEWINLEFGFKHDASGSRIVPSLTSITMEPAEFGYSYQLVADSNITRIVERDILMKGVPAP